MTTYTVFRRNDGYVDAIAGNNYGLDRRCFEILLETEDWNVARECIIAEREGN